MGEGARGQPVCRFRRRQGGCGRSALERAIGLQEEQVRHFSQNLQASAAGSEEERRTRPANVASSRLIVTSARERRRAESSSVSPCPVTARAPSRREAAGQRTRLALGALDDLAVLLEVDRPCLDVARRRLDVELEHAVSLLNLGLLLGVRHLGERVREGLRGRRGKEGGVSEKGDGEGGG